MYINRASRDRVDLIQGKITGVSSRKMENNRSDRCLRERRAFILHSYLDKSTRDARKITPEIRAIKSKANSYTRRATGSSETRKWRARDKGPPSANGNGKPYVEFSMIPRTRHTGDTIGFSLRGSVYCYFSSSRTRGTWARSMARGGRDSWRIQRNCPIIGLVMALVSPRCTGHHRRNDLISMPLHTPLRRGSRGRTRRRGELIWRAIIPAKGLRFTSGHTYERT